MKFQVPGYPKLVVCVALGVVATAGCGGPAQTAGVPPQTYEPAKPAPDSTAPAPDPNAPKPEPEEPKETMPPPGAAPTSFDET